MLKRFSFLSGWALALLASTASPAVVSSMTLLEVIQNRTDLSLLAGIINGSEFASTSFGALPGNVTIFAPVNEAIQGIPPAQLGAIAANTATLIMVLLYHVVLGVVTAENVLALPNETEVMTVGGAPVVITFDDAGAPSVNDAQIIETDIFASNGVIHTISELLIPPDLTLTIVDYLERNNETFSSILGLLDEAGMTDVLNSTDSANNTLLAPTNDAIAALSPDQLAIITSTPENLKYVLGYHYIPNPLPIALLPLSLFVRTSINVSVGITVPANLTDGPFLFNDVPVVQADVFVSNGFVQHLDGILFPPSVLDFMTNIPEISNVTDLIQAAGLADVLEKRFFEPDASPVSVFTPINQFIGALPPDLLERLQKPEWKRHLECFLNAHIAKEPILYEDLMVGQTMDTACDGFALEVESVYRNEQQLPAANINGVAMYDINAIASNGPIYLLVNGTFLPPAVAVNILDIGRADGGFTTLIDLVVSAGLEDALNMVGPYTLFAPTDEAFNKVDQATLDVLRANATLLTSVLTYHVIGNNVFSDEVMGLPSGSMVPTLQGGNLTVTSGPDGAVKINDAMVIDVDILAANGVIHVIDTVLIPDIMIPMPPPGMTSAPAGDTSTMAPTAAPTSGTASATPAPVGAGAGATSSPTDEAPTSGATKTMTTTTMMMMMTTMAVSATTFAFLSMN